MQNSNPNKEQNGYRLGGEHDGMFLCADCRMEHDQYVIDREHHPLSPVTCLVCNEICISPG